MQMLITMVCGLIQLRYPLGTYKPVLGQKKPANFVKGMATLGLLQLGTIMFGLIAIYFVAVSFAETVKSSAPLFTVLIAWLYLGERTGAFVFLSLIPVMLGLALCSSNELSFSLIGFVCALTTNLCECVQSVVSKSLLSNKAYIYKLSGIQAEVMDTKQSVRNTGEGQEYRVHTTFARKDTSRVHEFKQGY
nr:solute carrier family 35 member E2A-like [Penaeus vannamei]